MAMAVDTVEFTMEPLVKGWLGKLEEAARARQKWDDVGDQCHAFFASATGFMWRDEYLRKYLKGMPVPKFKITLNKSFELVAVFGPSLYWTNPQRVVEPRRLIEVPPEVFGPLNDPIAAHLHQLAVAEKMETEAVRRVQSQLMQTYLNYTPVEQPGGGLRAHSLMAITEALVRGRGILLSEPYVTPGSDRVLTGSFWRPVKDLYLDPDAKQPHDAYWMAIRYEEPTWKVEREFGLPAGSLEGRGTSESYEARGAQMGDDLRNLHRAEKKTFDTIVYYKIWSKGGVGARLTGITSDIKETFDRAVGDYAYIVVSPSVPFPLNAPTHRVRNATMREVGEMFAWPIPFWRDGRWPINILDFYEDPEQAWPIPPMAPALGELTFMNFMISRICSQVWNNTRQLWAVMKSAIEKYRDTLLSDKETDILEINDGTGQRNINELVQQLRGAELSKDPYAALDIMGKLFEQRTGLYELLYAGNAGGVQSRTAEDARNKNNAAQVRPQYMGMRVSEWQTDIARQEKLCARWFVRGRDVQPLFGRVGAYLWDQHIATEDPSVIVFEMDARIEAGSHQRPDKERDVANMSQVLPVLFPELSKHADVTQDTGPINALLVEWGKVIEKPMDHLQMGPRAPAPPPPEMAEAAQAQQQFEQARMEMELQKGRLELEKMQLDAAGKAQERESRMIENAANLAFDRERHEQEMAQDQERHMLDMVQTAQEFQLKSRQAEVEGRMKLRLADQQGKLKLKQQRQQAKQRPKLKPAASSKR